MAWLEVLPFQLPSFNIFFWSGISWYCSLLLLYCSCCKLILLSASVASKYCSLLPFFLLCFFCSILLWQFFWLCILYFLCIKFIILSQKSVLSLFETSKNDFKILRGNKVSFSFFLLNQLISFIQNFSFGFYPTQTTKYESHLILLYIISYWFIMILLFLISKNIISSCRCSCYIYIFNFLNGLNLWLLKGLRNLERKMNLRCLIGHLVLLGTNKNYID